MEFRDQATLVLRTDTADSSRAMADLDQRAKQLRATLKEIEKTGPGKASEEWKKYRTELDAVQKEQDKLKKNVDVSRLSYGQLSNLVKQLTRDLRGLTPGTTQFVEATKRLQEARQRLDQVNDEVKGISKSTKVVVQDFTRMNNSALTFNQLAQKVGQLKARLGELNPASKEFIATQKQLAIAEKYYNSIKKGVDDTTAALKKYLRETDNSRLTYGQLQEKVKLLNEDLKKLPPNTKAFNDAVKQLGDAERQLAKVDTEVKQLKQGAETLAKPTLWERTKGLITNMSTAAVAGFAGIGFAIQSAVGTAIGKFREFEDAGNELSAVTGLVGNDLKKLKDEAKSVGPAAGMSAAEMLKAYQLMGSAKPDLLGNAAALAATTKEAIKLAQAGKIELPLATKVVAESLNQWGVSADQAGRFVNVIAAGAKEGSAEISEMSMSLKASGTVAAAANVSFEQTNAMLQSLSTIALKGEQSGTMLRNVLIKLQSGAKETNPAIVGMDKALENLGKQNLSTAQLAKMFGTENIVAAQHIIKHRTEIAELTKKMTGTQEATTQAQKNTQGLTSTIQQATAQITNYAVSFGEKLAPALKLGIEYGMAFLRALASLPKFISDNRVAIGLLAVGLISLNKQLIVSQAEKLKNLAIDKADFIQKRLQTAANDIRTAQLAKQTAAQAAANLTTQAGTVAANAATAATGRRTIAERLATVQSMAASVADKARTFWTNAVTVAQNALNLALRANPIGLVVTAVTALIAVFVTLYKNNEKVRAAVDGVWSVMKATGNWLASVFGPTLSKIGGYLSSLWSTATRLASSLSGPVNTALSSASAAFGTISKKVAGLVDVLKSVVNFVVGPFKSALSSLDSMTGGFLSKTVNTFKETGQKVSAAFTKGYNESLGKNMVAGAKKAATEAGKAKTEANTQTLQALKTQNEGADAEDLKRQKTKEKEAEKSRKKQLEAHKKHLEDMREANNNALKAIDELENLAYLEHIRRTKGEVEADKVALAQKLDAELLEVKKSLASEENKQKQRTLIIKKYEGEIDKLEEKAKEDSLKREEEKAKKQLEQAQKVLSHKQTILDQEFKAEMALLDGMELVHRNNSKKLLDLQKDRLDKEHAYKQQKLFLDQQIEEKQARIEIKDKTQLEETLLGIKRKYLTLSIEDVKAHEQAKADIEKKAKEDRDKRWEAGSAAFSSLLKGDLNAFVGHLGSMVQGEKSAWQKRIDENMAKYQAVAQMAQAAAQFLADIAKKKADKAIAEIQRERDANIAILQEKLDKEKQMQEQAEADRQKVKDESDAKIALIRESTEKTISDLEQQYRQLSSSEEKKKLNEQIQGYQDASEEKSQQAKEAADDAIEAAKREAQEAISAIKDREKEATKAAQNERNQKVDAAEATRDAEIAAIKARKDIDQATRAQLIKEAQDKFEKEKKMADDEAAFKIEQAQKEAKQKIDLANDTQKTKVELAEAQRDAELKAIDAVKRGDTEAAKEILARSKEDQREKIRLAKEEASKKIDEAEKEKREKLKKVEQEKAARIANQKELNRSIEDENKRAKQREAAEKLKAWKAQQKADMASAAISGALATIKALASGPFPLNIVFAAATAAATIIQVAKIKNQQPPQFAQGGMAPQAGIGGIPAGGRHGARYGDGGLAIVDRSTGQESGEMEGGEGIVSREQTEANLPLLQLMWKHARTPGLRNKPVVPLSGFRPMMRNGGLLPTLDGPMYLFGGKAKKARKAAEAEASSAESSAPAGGDDSAAYSGSTGDVEGAADAKAQGEEARKQGVRQLELLEGIQKEIKGMNSNLSTKLMLIAANTNATAGAARDTAQAVREGTAHNNIDRLLDKLGSFK